MFKNLIDTNFFKTVSDVANNTIIKHDRLRYKKVFDLLREKIIEYSDDDNNKIIFSDVSKLIDYENKNDIIEVNMTLYTIHARKITTELTNIIHVKFGKFVQMRAIIPNEEYDIMFDMRNLVKIYRIDRYKKVNLVDLFNTICIDKILYFPVNVELIDIYHKLYLPQYNEEWPSIIENENALYKYIQSDKYGGEINKKCIECKIKRKLDVYQIKLLMLKFLNNENFVFVGDWAHNIIEGDIKNIDDSSNIQIISENSIDTDYNNIIDYLSEFTNYGIFYKKKKLYIPKDNRIFKYTFYIKYPTFGKSIVDKQFLDIYNCGSYELIPFVPFKYDKLNLKIGNIFVQMRFIFIDLWILKLLKYLKSIDSKSYTIKTEYIFKNMKMIKKLLPDGFNNSKDKYIGINFDEKIYQKIEISKKEIKRASYYPELSIKNNKKYQLIATSS